MEPDKVKVRDEVRERVRRGGEWLDTQKPGWYYLIDLGGLDLGCGENCVLGQLYASEAGQLYASEAMGINGANGFSYGMNLVEPANHNYPASYFGFNIAYVDISARIRTLKAAYDELDAAWIEYIKGRVNNA